jgi:uncharacterized protein YciI
MKTRLLTIIVPAALLFTSLCRAQGPQHKLVQFQMAIMKKGPKWETTSAEERGRIFQQHLANVLSMHDAGKIAIAGPFGDDTNLVGIFIMRTASADEARTWVDGDPAVQAGLMAPEMHPWWSEDIFKKASLPLKLDTFYFGFFEEGTESKGRRRQGSSDSGATESAHREYRASR